MPEPQQPPRPRTPAVEARGITTSCPRCGVLHLASPAFVLVVCPSDPERSFYQFTCPRCAVLVTRHASERTVKGMSSCGVPLSTLPAEAMEVKTGPALTIDDLLDLVLQLESFDGSQPLADTTITIPEERAVAGDRAGDMAGDLAGDGEV